MDDLRDSEDDEQDDDDDDDDEIDQIMMFHQMMMTIQMSRMNGRMKMMRMRWKRILLILFSFLQELET